MKGEKVLIDTSVWIDYFSFVQPSLPTMTVASRITLADQKWKVFLSEGLCSGFLISSSVNPLKL